MTPQEALNVLSNTKFSVSNEAEEQKCRVYQSASKTAIEALKKRIPKKPYKTKELISQKQNDYYCSVCKCYLGDDMELKHACLQPEYCQHCGQALDWSDTE